MIGTTISHYRVVGELGRGGMGIVYRAEDTRLDRTVALKLLPLQALGSEDDRARFYREARAAAALNHANIGHIYEIDEAESDGGASQPFIAMEFIDGETLAQRIERGPLPLAEAISIAISIADGLKAAHDKDIVHRDVKSGNIMLTKGGAVKILDFGLAKTAASTKLTQMGSTIGTAAYMSPEQARGEEVDRRSDIWSLGVILYEMIAGRLPFGGDYEQAVVYGILNEDPESLTAIRAGVPLELDGIIGKLLAKSPELRYQNVDELPADLKALDAGSRVRTSRISTTTRPAAGQSAPSPSSPERRFPTGLVVSAVAAGAVLGAFLLWATLPQPEAPEKRVRRYVAIDAGRIQGIEDPGSFAAAYASPDGRRIAFAADNKLWIRNVDNLRAVPIPGTEGANGGEWTPDGRGVVFTTSRSYRRVLLDNFEISTLGDGIGGTWWEVLEDGTVAFIRGDHIEGPIATGVEPSPLTPDVPGLAVNGFAQIPGGRGFIVARQDSQQVQHIAVVTETGVRDILALPTGTEANDFVLAPTGHVVFAVEDNARRSTEVWALELDMDRLERVGEPRMIVSEALEATVGADGTLYYTDSSQSDTIDVVLMNASGEEIGVESGIPGATAPELSPDGRYISVAVFQGGANNIWVMDRRLGGLFQLSFDIENPWRPSWSPDSRRVAYHSRVTADRRAGDIYVQSIEGGASPQLLVGGQDNDWGPSWSPDGEWIVYTHRADSGGVSSIFRVRADGTGDPEPVVQERFSAAFPSVSPDGRYVAYSSNRSGQRDIYVSSYPDGERHFRVTSGGGEWPKWRGDRIFYVDTNTEDLMAVPVTTGSAFRSGESELVQSGDYLVGSTYIWDASADGREIAVVRERRSGVPPRVIAIENWLETVEF